MVGIANLSAKHNEVVEPDVPFYMIDAKGRLSLVILRLSSCHDLRLINHVGDVAVLREFDEVLRE